MACEPRNGTVAGMRVFLAGKGRCPDGGNMREIEFQNVRLVMGG
jgi:hypothetical protein